jgi:hypothetical protein
VNDTDNDMALLALLRERSETAWLESERLSRLADDNALLHEDAFYVALDRAIDASRTYNAVLSSNGRQS